MYLIDTSIWIDYINGLETEHVAFLDQLVPYPQAVGLTDLIYLEILQGANSQKTFDQFTRYFSGQLFYTLQYGKKSHAAAAQIYFDCRRRGITIRSSFDCLIAQCAIENDLTLLHNDKDFSQIASVVTSLKQKCFM